VDANGHSSKIGDGVVWKVFGPILVSVVLLGGGAWLNYVQGELGEVKSDQKQTHIEQESLGRTTTELKVRVEQLNRDVEELKKSSKTVEKNTEKILNRLEEK